MQYTVTCYIHIKYLAVLKSPLSTLLFDADKSFSENLPFHLRGKKVTIRIDKHNTVVTDILYKREEIS